MLSEVNLGRSASKTDAQPLSCSPSPVDLIHAHKHTLLSGFSLQGRLALMTLALALGSGVSRSYGGYGGCQTCYQNWPQKQSSLPSFFISNQMFSCCLREMEEFFPSASDFSTNKFRVGKNKDFFFTSLSRSSATICSCKEQKQPLELYLDLYCYITLSAGNLANLIQYPSL